MNFKKIALGLLFGGALAIGSVACDDSTADSGSGGSGGSGGTLPQACATIGSDPDSATTPFVAIRSLSLPDDDGFNIDGINNAARGGAGGGSGRTIAGCDEQDIAYGKDNSLAKVAAALATTIDLNEALDETVQPAPVGTLLIEAQLNHLSAADVATDPCVGATIRVTPAGGSPTMYTGSGSLTDHVASLSFGDFLSFTVALTVPAESCNGGACNPASLTIRVDKPVALVTMNATNTAIQPGSIIGGFIFFEDTSGGYDNATGFKAALLQYTSDVNLMMTLEDTAVGAFEGARDLHMNPDRTIAPCTAPGGNASLVNRNSVSVGLAVDSL